MTKIRNLARERLEKGELALGAGVRIVRSVEIAKLMKTAGYDWLFIDLEHSSMTLDAASQISIAALDSAIAPIVRIPSGEFSMATRALDNGALGIVVPHVNDATGARQVVEKLKFPPLGHRSIAGGAPQFDFQSIKTTEFAETLNSATLIVVMLETPQAVENADEIAAVPGVDVLLVGTNDLCAEMGIHGEFGHPRIEDAYRKAAAACRRHHKWLGMGGVYSQDTMQCYIEIGARFILSGNDLSFLLAGATTRADFLHKIAV